MLVGLTAMVQYRTGQTAMMQSRHVSGTDCPGVVVMGLHVCIVMLVETWVETVGRRWCAFWLLCLFMSNAFCWSCCFIRKSPYSGDKFWVSFHTAENLEFILKWNLNVARHKFLYWTANVAIVHHPVYYLILLLVVVIFHVALLYLLQ